MSDHRRETILENIKTTLEAVTSLSTASIQRWNHRGNPTVTIPTIVIASGREEKERMTPQMICRFSVFIDVYFRQDDTNAALDTDTLLNALLLDIEKALSANHTLTGACENLIERAVSPFEVVDQPPQCGMTLEYEVLYRHKETDPSLKS